MTASVARASAGRRPDPAKLLQAVQAHERPGREDAVAQTTEQVGAAGERFDVAVTRALADMKTLAELCLPLVKVGGGLIAGDSLAALGIGILGLLKTIL